MGKKYSSYTAVNQKWVGHIPSHWEIIKAKRVVRITNGSDPSTRGNIPVYGSGGAFKTCGEFKEPPAVLLGRKGTINNPQYVDFKYWNVDTAFDVHTKSNLIDLKYYFYCAFLFDYDFYITQTALPSMTQTDYGNMYIPVPPRDEQDQIVRFLDWKISGINKLIKIKRDKIVNLLDLKKSVIRNAVTHGIKSVPLKYSGIYWLKHIPQTWNAVKIKRLTCLSKEKSQNSSLQYLGLENVLSWEGKYTLSESIVPESITSNFYNGNIIFGKLRPYLAKAIIADFNGVCSTEFLVLKDIKCEKEFMLYAMLNEEFIDLVNSSTYGAKMPRANWGFIGNVKIPVPPMEEQKAIVAFLKRKTKIIGELILSLQSQITELKSLKVALISNAVTGKIDVRDIEIPEYERIEEDLGEDAKRNNSLAKLNLSEIPTNWNRGRA